MANEVMTVGETVALSCKECDRRFLLTLEPGKRMPPSFKESTPEDFEEVVACPFCGYGPVTKPRGRQKSSAK